MAEMELWHAQQFQSDQQTGEHSEVISSLMSLQWRAVYSYDII